MRFQLTDGQVVLIDRPFKFNGNNYPSTWLRNMTPTDRVAFGATELPEPEAPVTPASPAEPRWSFLEFMDRFTQEEQEAIAGAAMVNVHVKLWYDKAVGAREILPSDERTIAGVQALVTAELLTQQRANEILGMA